MITEHGYKMSHFCGLESGIGLTLGNGGGAGITIGNGEGYYAKDGNGSGSLLAFTDAGCLNQGGFGDGCAEGATGRALYGG